MKKSAHLVLAPLHYRIEDAGSETGWAYWLLRGLQKSYTGNITAITGWKAQQLPSQPTTTSVQEVYGKPFTPSLYESLRFHLRVFLAVKRLKQQPGLIHHFLPFALHRTFSWIALSPRFVKVPFILGPIQAPPTWGESPTGLKALAQALAAIPAKMASTLTLRRAQCVVVLEEQMASVIRPLISAKQELIVIPAGISASQYHYAQRVVKKGEPLRLVTVANLLPHKGVDLCVEAVQLLVAQGLEVELVIVGDGPLRERLELQVTSAALTSNVKLIGKVLAQEVEAYYQQAHVFVAMSSFESWGQVYLEAMASGLPVVAAANNGVSAVVSEARTGYSLPVRTAEALAEKLAYLYANPDKVASFSAAARERVELCFDWEKAVIPAYLDVYRRYDMSNHSNV